MEIVFWIALFGAAYAYFGYPLVLAVMGKVLRSKSSREMQHSELPSVSVVIPAHNEASIIGAKLENCAALKYSGPLQVIVVSDGSTDETADCVRPYLNARTIFEDIPVRKGKANALNRGISLAQGEIIVFSDASIELDPDALDEAVRSFADPGIGCVSGEDRITGGSGEGMYGRYELFLRRAESALGSIVGASGSFYAQRKQIVSPFPEGAAPDFLSVLSTVRSGFRAVSNPRAVGYMKSAKGGRREFRRKVRTVLRGMTALFSNADMLNLVKYPMFAFSLLSHKLIRWLVPAFLIVLLGANFVLWGSTFYQVTVVFQIVFYAIGLLALIDNQRLSENAVIRIVGFFCISNAAILVAWAQYFRGTRQEIWGPTKRAQND